MRKNRRKIEQFTFSISRGGGKGEQIRGKIKKRKKEKNYFQPAGEEERRRARWQGRSWTCSSRRSTTCSPRCTTGWKQSTQVREQTNKKQQRKRFVAVISWRLLRTGNYGIGIYVKQICVGVLGFSLNIEISFPPKEYEFSCCCCRQLLDSMSEHSLLMRFESGGRHVPITVHNQMQSNLHESTQWRNWNLNRSKNFRTECAVDQICGQDSVCIKYSCHPPLASCLQCFQLQWYEVNFLS